MNVTSPSWIHIKRQETQEKTANRIMSLFPPGANVSHEKKFKKKPTHLEHMSAGVLVVFPHGPDKEPSHVVRVLDRLRRVLNQEINQSIGR